MGIRVRSDGTCGTIVIERPDRRNALDRSALADLSQALEDLYRQAAVRAIIITGEGEYFSSGTDLHEVHDDLDADDAHQTWYDDARRQRELLVQMVQLPKPIIAAVNGPALGLGLGLAAAADLALASSNATFGLPESMRGLTAGATIPFVAHRIGAGHTAHLLFRAQKIGAQQALALGLVQAVVNFDLLWAQAKQWSDEIAATSHISLSLSKQILNEPFTEAIIGSAAAATATARTTEHASEGLRAFLAKQQPKWP